MLKKILIVAVILGAIGGGVGWYMWHKPHPKVEDATGIAITATNLAKEYAADEKATDAKYLNKAIEVTGTVSETETNQDGGLMVILDSGDPTSGVQCTMRDKTAKAAKGQNLTIKGFCSGNSITGVLLTDCVIK